MHEHRDGARSELGLGGLGTATVSDALDLLGISGGCPGLHPIVPGRPCLGPAYTIRFERVARGEKAPAADYLEDVPRGSVVVLDNAGRTDCTVWGEILATHAVARHIAGTIIDGCCRDTARLQALGYPVYARGSFMKSGKNRVRMVASQVPVALGATSVRPFDVVLADDDGVVVIPADRAEQVTRLAREVAAMEHRVLVALAAGVPLAEARRAEGYHRVAWRGDR